MLVWFRDDLRVSDNPALFSAVQSGRAVVCVHVRDTVSQDLRRPGAAQDWMLHHGLVALEKSLFALGAKLVVRSGPSHEVIADLVAETGAKLVHWNRRHSGPEVAIDKKLKAALIASGVETHSFQANLLHEPTTLLTGAGGPYRVYSPFWRAFEKLPAPRAPLPAPMAIQGHQQEIESLAVSDLGLLPTRPDWAGGLRENWLAGEAGAMALLQEFLQVGIIGYGQGRDFPSKPHVSKLSPYLRFGMISPFQIWHEAGKAAAPAHDLEKFRKELVWREFSWHLLFHYPDLHWRNFDQRFDEFPWLTQSPGLDAWKKGMTGYPIVDAGMRQLWQTGYMHNRVRMIVASFLIKHMMVDWRVGETWFWDTLVDGDPASNSASWQWVAGCGADAAPYFRIFNPVIQGGKFDPDGAYVRKFVPELSGLSDRYLHKPWEAPLEVLFKARIKLGDTYPKPLVDHARARDRASQAFESLKKAG